MAGGGSDGSGTLLYMAPERFENQIADRRSDLYSVGIMAYQLLTGGFPFEATDDAAIERWHKSGDRTLRIGSSKPLWQVQLS